MNGRSPSRLPAGVPINPKRPTTAATPASVFCAGVNKGDSGMSITAIPCPCSPRERDRKLVSSDSAVRAFSMQASVQVLELNKFSPGSVKNGITKSRAKPR